MQITVLVYNKPTIKAFKNLYVFKSNEYVTQLSAISNPSDLEQSFLICFNLQFTLAPFFIQNRRGMQFTPALVYKKITYQNV